MAHKFHISTFSMRLHAARDIKEGEEIFATYTDNLQPVAERARRLLLSGVECTCRADLDPARSNPIRVAVKCRPVLFSPRSQRQILARIEEEELQDSTEYRQTLR
ncbi:hypothetical protein DFS33DRAFT_1277371 [Desarmillaria ectypa]|nr:hypothetical protein DFS33DRAFT_1277371 [Desarmillaria ectypa]